MTPIEVVIDCATRLGRDDVADTVRVAVERARRSQTYVVVMGEFKQGKSSLVNALMGRHVCPEDDDTATAVVTMVEHGTRDAASIWRDGAAVRIDDPAETIRGTADGAAERVCIEVVDAGLPPGLVVIDTPGIGGLDGGHTIATLAFLPFADAVLFVSDATAEYSAAEIDWLERAVATGAHMIGVLTKTDLAPSWRQIQQLDQRHLVRHGIEIPVAPTSAAVHQLAIDVGDAALAIDSGIPALRDVLVSEVIDPSRRRESRRAVTTARHMARLLAHQLRTETTLLGTGADEAAFEAQTARTRLEHLRGPATKWQQRLGDRSADIANAATHAFRASMRTVGQSIDARVEQLASPTDWADFARELQLQLANAATEVFSDIDGAFADLRTELYDLIAESAPDVGTSNWAIDAPDVDQLVATANRADTGQSRALTAVRGAQSGVMLFGFLGQLLPAAAGALLLSSPITLVLGGAFAGKALLDVRKRSLTVRRAQLKTAARKVLDDAQFELGNRVSEYVRTSTRSLRDEVSDSLALAVRTQSAALATANELAAATEADRSSRLAELRSIAADLRTADHQLREGT